MKRLGEILLDRGAIAISELHTGLEACHHSGGRLGTQLLKFGFVDEHALLEALSEQLGVPPATAAVLRNAPDPLRRMIPVPVARRLQVMVFDRLDGNLSVAMTNPRSPATIEEVVGYIGLDIKPHIATEIGILRALSGVKDQESMSDAKPADEPDVVGIVDEWRKLWSPPAIRATDLFRPLGKQARAEIPMAATFPGLAPVPTSGVAAAASPLDDEGYRALLRDTEHRDEVGALVLRRAAVHLGRRYLLAVHSGKVVGWLAGGAGVVLDDVQSFAVAQEAPSILSTISVGESFCGMLPAGNVNDALVEILGSPPPAEVAIVPVSVKNRVVAYLVGDRPGTELSRATLDDLAQAVRKAGIALEILILKKKVSA